MSQRDRKSRSRASDGDDHDEEALPAAEPAPAGLALRALVAEVGDRAMNDQVLIQLLDDDGNWYTPGQVPAAIKAVRAISADIREFSGTYSDADLGELRKALNELGETISRRIGLGRGDQR